MRTAIPCSQAVKRRQRHNDTHAKNRFLSSNSQPGRGKYRVPAFLSMGPLEWYAVKGFADRIHEVKITFTYPVNCVTFKNVA
jgi:hypothetical protein